LTRGKGLFAQFKACPSSAAGVSNPVLTTQREATKTKFENEVVASGSFPTAAGVENTFTLKFNYVITAGS
jgi:hypothetical protein